MHHPCGKGTHTLSAIDAAEAQGVCHACTQHCYGEQGCQRFKWKMYFKVEKQMLHPAVDSLPELARYEKQRYESRRDCKAGVERSCVKQHVDNVGDLLMVCFGGERE